MEEESEALKAALRVRAAVTEHCVPEVADVQALLLHASPYNGRPPDEVACEVIHRVLRARGRDFATRHDGWV